MHSVSRFGIVGAVALLSLMLDGVGGPAAAQNGSSFLNASTSAIDYRVSHLTVRRPGTTTLSYRPR